VSRGLGDVYKRQEGSLLAPRASSLRAFPYPRSGTLVVA
jgi:hypothetical protein